MRSITHVDGAVVTAVTVAGSIEGLLDDVVVTTFDCDVVGTFTRVAAISPSQNFLSAQHRDLAHHAAGVTRRWLRSEADPLVALTAANTALYEGVNHHAFASTVCVAWADFAVGDDDVHLICAGRVGGGTVAAITREGTRIVPLVSEPVIDSATRQELTGTVFNTSGETRGGRRWAAEQQLRVAQHLQPEDWLHAPLGINPIIEPDLFMPDSAESFEQLLVSTPGLELADVSVSWLGFERHLNAITTRPGPYGQGRHGDIAAAVVTAAEPDIDD